MQSTLRTAFDYIMQDEGQDKYTDNKLDPGGPTKFGVTERKFVAWLRFHGKPTRPVSTIERHEAFAIFRDDYWKVIRADDMPRGIDYVMADSAFHHGPTGATMILQRAINKLLDRKIAVDGEMGSVTLDAVQDLDAERLMDAILDERIEYMKGRQGWSTFEKGWRNRVAKVRNRARAMIEMSPSSAEKQKPVFPETVESKPHPKQPMAKREHSPVLLILLALAALAAVIGERLGLIGG